jgi:sugar phosphate isomerase/epimerase
MIRLGGHGLPVGSDDPDAFAQAHLDFGYAAAYCPKIPLTDTPRIKAFRDAFARADVTIAEVGIWRNLITPDDAERKANLDHAIECLALADEVGAGCAVTYVGSFAAGTGYAPHPRNLTDEGFAAAAETARKVIDAVNPRRAKFAYEMMQYTVPDSIAQYRALIDAIDRPGFAAHLDPVNFVIAPRQYFDTGALIRECFAVLGRFLVSCHAKDIVLHDQAALHFDEIMPGRGGLDYRAYLTELDKLGGGLPLLLEHLPDADYAVARDALFAIGDASGVAFAKRPPH